MDVDSLKIALSLTTLGLVLALTYREYIGIQNHLRRQRNRRR